MHLGSPAVANVISSSVVILFVSNHSSILWLRILLGWKDIIQVGFID